MNPLPVKTYCLRYAGYRASIVGFALCFPILGIPTIIGMAISDSEDAGVFPSIAGLAVGSICMVVIMKLWEKRFEKEELLAFTDQGISSKIYGEIPYSSLTTYEVVRATLPRSAEPIEGGMLKVWTSDKKVLRFFFLRTDKINGTKLLNETVSDFEEKIRQYQAKAASGLFVHESIQIVRRPNFFVTWYDFAISSVLIACAVVVVLFASNCSPGGIVMAGILLFIWLAIYHVRRNSIGKNSRRLQCKLPRATKITQATDAWQLMPAQNRRTPSTRIRRR